MKKLIVLIAILIASISSYSQNYCIGVGIGGPSFIAKGDTMALYGYAYDQYTSNKTYTFVWGNGKTETATLTNMGTTSVVWDTIIPTEQSTYTITATDAKGCINTATLSPQFLIADTVFITS